LSADPHLWIVVLAGGAGSRFWPVSTRDRPKQLLRLAGENPLIVDTLDRARALAPDERIRVLTGRHLEVPFRAVLSDLPDECYLFEPHPRGTCPGLTWAAHEVSRIDPDAVLVSLHSDHRIQPLEAFRDVVRAAARLAREKDCLVTVGVVPDRPETGYGYIQPGAPLAIPGGEAFTVERFHEKPDAEAARRYVEAGYLWNSGVFAWKASVFLDEVGRHAPEVADHLDLLEGGGPEAFFRSVSDCVVDRVILERSSSVACVRATFQWDDVGSWDALGRTGQADARGNTVRGPGDVVGGKDNVVFAEGGRVVVWGVDDLVVIRTAATTLVLPRERAPDLKSLLTELGEEP
jgi:mannose-1-phosphate guanylyltransferase